MRVPISDRSELLPVLLRERNPLARRASEELGKTAASAGAAMIRRAAADRGEPRRVSGRVNGQSGRPHEQENDPMGYGAATDLPTIIQAITGQLTTVGTMALASTGNPFDPSQILPTLARDQDIEAMPMKDLFLAVRPKSFPINIPERAGGGRQQLAIDGTIEFLFYSRLWLGNINNDYQSMVNASFGVLANWKAILASLEQFSPLNGDGDCILRQPMRVLDFDIVPRRLNKPGWTRLDSLWEVKFVQALS